MDAQTGMLAQLFGRSMGARSRAGGVRRLVRGAPQGRSGQLCPWMTHSNMPEMKVVSRTIRKEREDVLDWWRWSLTSAILEGLSSVIQSARRAAREFRNTGCFETMIFLRLGLLDFPAQVAVSSATCKKQRRAQKVQCT